MSATVPNVGLDPGTVAARTTENVAVGREIVRHRFSSRVIHWSVAISFLLTLASGLPIWSPVFVWMAYLFGGLGVCRVLHSWFGVAFSLSAIVMFFHWASDMAMSKAEKSWVGPKLMERMEEHLPETGKYNAGQKLLFFLWFLAALALLASGIVIWFPETFPRVLREASILLHEVTFILFTISIVAHVYLGTVAEPGTFRAMTRGTVTKGWAALHHPKWYRDVTGEEPGRK